MLRSSRIRSGMDHLAPAVPQLDLAGNVAALAHGQDLLQAGLLAVEEDQGHVSRLVLHEDPIRRAAARRWSTVGDDGDGERHGLAHGSVGDRALHLPGDAAGRDVEEQIRDARRLAGLAEEPVEEGGDLRPHAGQGGGRGEQWIENGRTQ